MFLFPKHQNLLQKIFVLIIFSLFSSLSLINFGQAAEDSKKKIPPLAPHRFAHNFELVSPKAIDLGSILSLPLGQEVLRSLTQPDLSDIGIFNAKAELVPFGIFEPEQAASSSLREQKLKLFPIYSSEDNHSNPDLRDLYELQDDGQLLPKLKPRGKDAAQTPIGYILVLPADKVSLKKLTFKLQANSVAKARLDASSNLQDWTNLSPSFTLASLEQSYGNESETLELNELKLDKWLNSRYLRITFIEDQLKLYEVSASVSALYAQEPSLEKIRVLPSSALKESEKLRLNKGASNKAEEQAFFFDLGGVFPNRNLNLIFNKSGLIKNVNVYKRKSENEEWQHVLRGSFYATQYKNEIIHNKSYDISAQAPARYWKLSPTAVGKALPKDIQLELEYLPQKLYFLAQGAGPYTLACGSPDYRPEQSINTLMSSAPTGNFSGNFSGNSSGDSSGNFSGNSSGDFSDYSPSNAVESSYASQYFPTVQIVRKEVLDPADSNKVWLNGWRLYGFCTILVAAVLAMFYISKRLRKEPEPIEGEGVEGAEGEEGLEGQELDENGLVVLSPEEEEEAERIRRNKKKYDEEHW